MPTGWINKPASVAVGTRRYRSLILILSIIGFHFSVAAHATINPNQFVEATDAGTPVIDAPGETWGAAWGDFDGDNDPDLWLGKHQFTPTGLFRNNGDGTFTDVIDTAVINASAHYDDDTHGASWVDFDNDGDKDLLEVCGAGGGASGPVTDAKRNNLFVNNAGILTEQAQSFGLDYPLASSRTPAWFDYDNDGLLDVFIAALQHGQQLPSAVFRQTATGFQDTSVETGFDVVGSCQNAMPSHLGPNGDPALVCGDSSRIQTIHDISTIPFTDLQPTIGNDIYNVYPFDLATGDFDGDQLVDVFAGITAPNPSMAVQTGPGGDRIHAFVKPSASESGFSFTAPGDVPIDFGFETEETDIFLGANGVAPPAGSDQGLRGPGVYPHHVQFTLSASNPDHQGISATRTAGIYIGLVGGNWEVRVVNAAKNVDVMVVAAGISAPAPIGSLVTNQGTPRVPILFLQDQAGQLVKRTTGQAFLDPASAIETYARSVVAFDADNDRDLDVYVGSSGRVANVPNLLFENQGNGTFGLVTDAGGAAGHLFLGRTDTVTVVDYDQDGFLDLFVTQGNFPAPFSYAATQQLFRNQGNGNHWIQVDLEGVTSNRDGIGAVVYATTPDQMVQMREHNNGVHRYAQDFPRIHFGLAQYTTVDLQVVWPSGIVDNFPGLPADQIHHLVEGTGTGASQPACGQPTYDKATETGIFLWYECANVDQWHVRVTAGGQSVSYQGNVTSGQPFESLTTFSFEGSDVLQPGPFSTPTAGPISFTMNVGNTGHDGIDFAIAPGAGGCVSVTAPGGLPVWAGADRVPVGETVDLTDFGPCTGSAFTLSAADVNVNEAAGPAVFTVNLAPAPAAGAQVQVSYQTADGSALAGSDYTATSGTLTFGPGETQKTVSVPITNDTTPESNETFSLMLTSVDTNPATATATISDDDSASQPACGQPTYDKATETGIFLWYECANVDQWHLRVTAGGQSVSYQGNVTSGQPFESLTTFSFEGSDVLQPAPFSTPTAGPISFTMNVGNTGHDGIDFAIAPGAGGCVSLTAPGGLPVWAGSNRVPVGETVDLTNFGLCP